jgi:hypothetical protein
VIFATSASVLAPHLHSLRTDELYGPVFVCVLLFAAVLANFIIRVKSHNGKMKPPKSPWLAAYMGYFLEMQDPSNNTLNYNDY